MSLIYEERESIIRENNTAQTVFSDIIKDLKSDVVELNINTPLDGDVDLSICKFPRLRTVIFGEGKITNLINIPQHITKLVCAGNLLIELDDLPNSLLHLDCARNYLTTIDFKKIPHIQELHCEDNKIEDFGVLPKSIIALYCDHNKLKHINLKDMKDLKTLHISNNPLVIVENLPETIHEFISENNPIAITETEGNDEPKDRVEKKLNYAEALAKYFKMKSKYEEEVMDKRRAAYRRGTSKKDKAARSAAVKPKCIKCSRPVGTVFSTDINGYRAICGDKEHPCGLDIKLSRGNYELSESILEAFRDAMNDTKDRIIKLKMDTLFNYVSESASSKLFKRKMDDYNKDSKIYKDELDRYNDLYNNTHKKELIKTKMALIHGIHKDIRGMLLEYTASDNKNLLTTIIETYTKDLLPEIENLRRLKNDIMEMNYEMNLNSPNMSILYQSEVALSKCEYLYGEPPNVIKFSV
jgi:hypothetical protein